VRTGDNRRRLDRFIEQGADSALSTLNREYDVRERLDDLYRSVGMGPDHRADLEGTRLGAGRNRSPRADRPWLPVCGAGAVATVAGLAAAVLTAAADPGLPAVIGSAGSAGALAFGTALSTLRFLRDRR
jgi:hypothetical protein